MADIIVPDLGFAPPLSISSSVISAPPSIRLSDLCLADVALHDPVAVVSRVRLIAHDKWVRGARRGRKSHHAHWLQRSSGAQQLRQPHSMHQRPRNRAVLLQEGRWTKLPTPLRAPWKIGDLETGRLLPVMT
jgi:hypothetical protein